VVLTYEHRLQLVLERFDFEIETRCGRVIPFLRTSEKAFTFILQGSDLCPNLLWAPMPGRRDALVLLGQQGLNKRLNQLLHFRIIIFNYEALQAGINRNWVKVRFQNCVSQGYSRYRENRTQQCGWVHPQTGTEFIERFG
jgi:hypothetical protein